MLEKVLKDLYYKDTYRVYQDLSKVVEAGFFDDKLKTLDYNLDLLCTPWHKLSKPRTKKTVVLLSTGSFSPLHQGHIQMMELAKKSLEEKGYEVLGGYLSLSHDDYVKQKYEGKAFIPGALRQEICDKILNYHPWLMIDPWEFNFVKGPINFTDVILRLKQYLLKHLNINPEVAYIFGSDNVAFARAFIDKDLGVCIEREGTNLKILEEPVLKSNPRVVFIPCKSNKSSSSKVRSGDFSYFFEEVKDFFENKKNSTKSYVFRDDMSESLTVKLPVDKIKNFKKQVIASFKQALVKGHSWEQKVKINSIILKVKEQRKLVKKINAPTISLDLYILGDYNVSFSRKFHIADGQVGPQKLVSRTSEDLSKQIKSIKKGEYVLIEDDVASGRTLALFYSLLPKNIKIIKEFILTHEQGVEGFYDIVDFRDFILGAKNSGLKSELPSGASCRIPYMLPYVSLKSRAKINPSQEKSLSLSLWTANWRLYKNSGVKLKDLDEDTQNLMKYIGFQDDSLVEEISLWHMKRLK